MQTEYHLNTSRTFKQNATIGLHGEQKNIFSAMYPWIALQTTLWVL